LKTNTIPERLINFRVYSGGSNDLKGVADIDLPSFENVTDTVKGAGIMGEYDSPTLGHFKAMTLTLNWRTVEESLLLMLRQEAQRLDCRGAFQDYDAGKGEYAVRSVRIIVQGPPIKVTPGKFSEGASTGGSTEIEAMYIKVSIDGAVIVEIDKLNYICKIGDVDYMDKVRTALGL
jgi:P2 family phage contractile tail tube protein